MSNFHQYLIPRKISQVVSIVILFLVIKKPVWTKFVFAFIFVAAGVFNLYTSVRRPEFFPFIKL